MTTLGEVMDYRAVVDGNHRMRNIVSAARAKDVCLDGHCPNLFGDDLGSATCSAENSAADDARRIRWSARAPLP
ncbi:hypothetical protein [Streptomyces sp. NPDC058695]|uniref:hypothetical protein n=1 Tax=Streptomyces sp. NPDC058695 TaxID=3346604 RepID=UPI00365F9392